MRSFKLACICLVAVLFTVHAKNTYSVFSLGLAVPTSSAAPMYDLDYNYVGDKNLKPGWEGGLTFFGLPFTKLENALSGLALGGKINFCRWERDSTLKELTFLGTQGIVRYYLPLLKIKPFDLFAQIGCGMFIGEHGFADHDSIPASPKPNDLKVTEGQKDLGVSFNIGIDWDVIEFTPGMTMVLTSDKPSMWFSLNAAAKF
jgi:hypothetical protein